MIFINGLKLIENTFPKLSELAGLFDSLLVEEVQIDQMRIFISSVDDVPNLLIFFDKVVLESRNIL